MRGVSLNTSSVKEHKQMDKGPRSKAEGLPGDGTVLPQKKHILQYANKRGKEASLW